MDELLQDKLDLLQLYYPNYKPSILKDLLFSCSNDIDATRSLIDGNTASSKKRVALAQHHLEGIPAKRKQPSSVKPKVSKTESSKRAASEIITLHTAGDVEEHLAPYASLQQNFLPLELSTQLLEDMVAHKHTFKNLQFYLFGNQCESNHLNGTFARPESDLPPVVYNGLQCRKHTPYTETMEKVAIYIEKHMNDHVIKERAPLAYQRKEKWTNDFTVVNYYEGLRNNLEWHSDRLSHIGPHNFVVSISLGCTRMFRLRSTHKENAPIYQIPLHHNSIFIMRPGCQEEFKHTINPMRKAIDVHPKYGTLRVGITARFYPVSFILNSPQCKCGIRMTLRRAYKSVATRGRYFWSCENKYQNKDCGTFHWADFKNEKGHYIADSVDEVSIWVAPEDEEKHNYDKENTVD